MLYIHIPEYSIYSIGYWHIHISIYNIHIHVTSGHIFSGKYGHTCTLCYLILHYNIFIPATYTGGGGCGMSHEGHWSPHSQWNQQSNAILLLYEDSPHLDIRNIPVVWGSLYLFLITIFKYSLAKKIQYLRSYNIYVSYTVYVSWINIWSSVRFTNSKLWQWLYSFDKRSWLCVQYNILSSD